MKQGALNQVVIIMMYVNKVQGFPCSLAVQNSSAHAGDVKDTDLIPGWGRSPGGGYGNPLPYSCLENPMDRGACWATVYRVGKNQTGLKQLSTTKYNADISSPGPTGQ